MDYLKQYEEAYQKAEVKDNTSFDELPDGKYRVQVDRVELSKSKTSGRPHLVWEFVVIEGKFKGRRIWKYNGLNSVEQIEWLKNDLYTAGLELTRLSDLETRLGELLDQFLEINLKTKNTQKGPSQNVFINRMIEANNRVENRDFRSNRQNNKPADPFSDDGKPIYISDDDLPF